MNEIGTKIIWKQNLKQELEPELLQEAETLLKLCKRMLQNGK